MPISSTDTKPDPKAADLPSTVSSAREEIEREVREVFVRAARLMGYPRSLGAIFGLLYISPEPLTMDQIRARLNISLGSASQGLRQLRAFRAVKVRYIPGQRKDHYVAEMSFRNIVSGFIEEEIRPHLDSGEDRLRTMHGLLDGISGEEGAVLRKKVDHLERLHKTGRQLLPVLVRLIKI